MGRGRVRAGQLRWWWVVLVGLLTAGIVPLAAAAEPGQADQPVRAAGAGDSMVAATQQATDRFRELWNANKLDQLVAEIYTDHSVLVPPNHDAIRGQAAIRDYLQDARNTVGEYSKSDVTYHVTSSESLVSLFGEYQFRSGQLRFNASEVYQRQPDGSVRNVLDMFGFR